MILNYASVCSMLCIPVQSAVTLAFQLLIAMLNKILLGQV